jgi:hypothetical protein
VICSGNWREVSKNTKSDVEKWCGMVVRREMEVIAKLCLEDGKVIIECPSLSRHFVG